MRRNVILSLAAFLLFSLAAVAMVALPKADHIQLTVHEWGTFTSVAGENGEAIAWRTYSAPGDLPCFVERFGGFKGVLSGTVRMETPVLYFYSPQDLSANVRVLFPKGTITEWYPKATTDRSYDAIEWNGIKVSPSAPAVFPSAGQSHYYAARQTDAAPLHVGSQKEKFLFYRGVGTFPLPISAKAVADGKIVVKNLGPDAVRGLILFENRGGRIRYQVVGSLEKEITLDPEPISNDLAALFKDLENVLVGESLYRKEAKAMIETWRDSWFEEGVRLFYIVPKPGIESILALNIEPAPSQISRVFVGRMEIITPEIQKDVLKAIANDDRLALEKHGRFLEPIARRMGIKSALLDSIYTNSFIRAESCNP